jgi:hypothetical protein
VIRNKTEYESLWDIGCIEAGQFDSMRDRVF